MANNDAHCMYSLSVFTFMSLLPSSRLCVSTYCGLTTKHKPKAAQLTRKVGKEKSTSKKKKKKKRLEHKSSVYHKGITLNSPMAFNPVLEVSQPAGSSPKAYQQQFLESLALHVEQMSIQRSPSQEVWQTFATLTCLWPQLCSVLGANQRSSWRHTAPLGENIQRPTPECLPFHHRPASVLKMTFDTNIVPSLLLTFLLFPGHRFVRCNCTTTHVTPRLFCASRSIHCSESVMVWTIDDI